jgi:RNA polymerase sigma-70 factor (ECF subfamily)
LKDYTVNDEVSIDSSSIHITTSGIEEKYNQEFLMEILKYLPDTTRIVFNLYVFEEYNHSEIGELLSMAERTSQSHLAKARKILSEKLDRTALINKMQRV